MLHYEERGKGEKKKRRRREEEEEVGEENM
jgi:hypothetical protein